METTVKDISFKLTQTVKEDKSEIELTEEEKVNMFLDTINYLKRSFIEKAEVVNNIVPILEELTFAEITDSKDEELLKDALILCKKYHTKLIQNYAYYKRKPGSSKLFKAEISNYKDAIDEFISAVQDVENIFFSLRRNEEFNKLMASL